MDIKILSKIKLKYLSHKVRRLQDKALIYTINGKNVSRKQFEKYIIKRIKENERNDRHGKRN